jgi:hypothetical protein
MACLLFTVFSYGQDIYLVNSNNEIKVLDLETLSVTDLFEIDPVEVGILNDLAFAPDGRLFGVSSSWKLVEIDLATATTTIIADLPIGGAYTSLVCSANNELFTSRISPPQLYKYDLDTNQLDMVVENISTPGDLTFYKGNLVYPNIFNDVIKGFDGSSNTNIGCSFPLIYTFVNDFVDCETNNIYALNFDAGLYLFDLETENYEFLANLSSTAGQLNGGATQTEYLASACPLEVLEPVVCNPLDTENFRENGITLISNPVERNIDFEVTIAGEIAYSIYSVEGRLVLDGKVDNKSISVSQLGSGIYFLRLIDENGILIFEGKIIKK